MIILKYIVSLSQASETQTFFPNKQKDAEEMVQWVKSLPHKIEGLSLNAQSYMKPDRSTPRASAVRQEV